MVLTKKNYVNSVSFACSRFNDIADQTVIIQLWVRSTRSLGVSDTTRDDGTVLPITQTIGVATKMMTRVRRAELSWTHNINTHTHARVAIFICVQGGTWRTDVFQSAVTSCTVKTKQNFLHVCDPQKPQFLTVRGIFFFLGTKGRTGKTTPLLMSLPEISHCSKYY